VVPCDEEGRQKQPAFPLTSARDRAAKHTDVGLSITLTEKVRRQSKYREQKGTLSPLHTAGKRRPRHADANVTANAFNVNDMADCKNVT
jgi:hypothetical protein